MSKFYPACFFVCVACKVKVDEIIRDPSCHSWQTKYPAIGLIYMQGLYFNNKRS
jgi:hypothetical protein